MTGVEIPGAAMIAGVGTWFFQGLAHRREMAKVRLEHSSVVEVSRDDLAIELLASARAEIKVARIEIEGLREEIKILRPLEQHFYYFQQALDHLDALLNAENEEAKTLSARNARAFLARMDRLKGARARSSGGA